MLGNINVQHLFIFPSLNKKKKQIKIVCVGLQGSVIFANSVSLYEVVPNRASCPLSVFQSTSKIVINTDVYSHYCISKYKLIWKAMFIYNLHIFTQHFNYTLISTTTILDSSSLNN